MAAPATPLVHLKVQVSGILSIPATELWEVVRDYALAHTWFGTYRGVKTFTTLLHGSINCQIGAMRYVTFGHLGFVDQLEALDDERFIMKYKLISHPENTNPFPGAFLNYQAVLHLEEVTRGDISFMKWCGEFDTEPQDCESMRQAISEVFEAGFQGLETMIHSLRQGYPAPSGTASIGAVRAGPGVRSTANIGDLQHDLTNLHLKHSSSMPVHAYSQAQQQDFPNANRRPSQMSRYMGELTEHTAAAPPMDSGYVGSSPKVTDVPPFSVRPESGGQQQSRPPQWTSGGSASTINISTLPNYRSGEGSDSGSRRQSRHRGTGRIPEGGTYPEAGPAGLQEQLDHIGKGQRDGRGGNRANLDLHHRNSSLGSLSSEPPTESPYQQSPAHPMDPLLQEREEFKAVLLATQKLAKIPSDSSLYSNPVGNKSPSEPDWSQVMQHKDEDVRVVSLSNSGVSSPHHTQAQGEAGRGQPEWSRTVRQREADNFQDGQRRGWAGKQNPQGPTPSLAGGGPFAAVNRNPAVNANTGMFQQKPVERSHSHQSLSTMSPVTSTALDHSAGSVYDEK